MTKNERKSYPQAVAKPVGKPVDNLARAGVVQPINLYKAFTGSRTTGEAIQNLLAAIVNANELLEARIHSLEMVVQDLAGALQLQQLLNEEGEAPEAPDHGSCPWRREQVRSAHGELSVYGRRCRLAKGHPGGHETPRNAKQSDAGVWYNPDTGKTVTQ